MSDLAIFDWPVYSQLDQPIHRTTKNIPLGDEFAQSLFRRSYAKIIFRMLFRQNLSAVVPSGYCAQRGRDSRWRGCVHSRKTADASWLTWRISIGQILKCKFHRRSLVDCECQNGSHNRPSARIFLAFYGKRSYISFKTFHTQNQSNVSANTIVGRGCQFRAFLELSARL